jgi:hypothetical protein
MRSHVGGPRAGTCAIMRNFVGRALADPQARAAKRAVYRERLFGDLADGRAAERAAALLAALIAPTEADRVWVDAAWRSVAGTADDERKRVRGAREAD